MSSNNKNRRINTKIKWLEIVELRSIDSDKDLLELQLEKLLAEIEKKIQGKEI